MIFSMFHKFPLVFNAVHQIFNDFHQCFIDFLGAQHACMHPCMSHFGSGPFWLRHCMHVCMHGNLAGGYFGSGIACMYACIHVPFWLGAILVQAMHAFMHARLSHFVPFWLGAILAQALYACMHACMSHFASGALWLRNCMDVCTHACPVLARRNFGSGSVSMYASTHVPFRVGAI